MRSIRDNIVKTPGETWVAHGLVVYAACALGRVIGDLTGSPLVWALALGSLVVVGYAAKELRERVGSWRLERTEGRAARYDGWGDLVLPAFVWSLAAVAPPYPDLGFWLAGVAALLWVAGQMYYRVLDP